MFGFQRKKCTAQTRGKIINKRSLGVNQPTMIYVRYEVDGTSYEFFETMKYGTEVATIGKNIPIGQKSKPKLGSTEIGKRVNVNYNPKKPEMAYLTDNVGIVDVLQK